MKGKLDEESRNVCIALKLGILSKGLCRVKVCRILVYASPVRSNLQVSFPALWVLCWMNITMYIGRQTTLPTASTLPWQRVKARGMEYSGFDITPDNGKTENYTFPTLFALISLSFICIIGIKSNDAKMMGCEVVGLIFFHGNNSFRCALIRWV